MILGNLMRAAPQFDVVEQERVEDGDWYALQPVVPVKAIRGVELERFLA